MGTRSTRALIPLILFLALTAHDCARLVAQDSITDYYNPLVYRRLDITVRLAKDGWATVEMGVTIRNEGDVLVVPGYGTVPLNLRGGNSTVEVLRSIDPDTGRKVEAVVLEVNGSKVVRYAMWDPLRPGEEKRVELAFRVSGVLARGLLFDEFGMTIGPLSNRVINGGLRVVPPPGEYITYSEPPGDGEWDLSGLGPGRTMRVNVEFGPIPFRSPIRGYILLWGGVAALALILILVRIRKRQRG